jgi:ABC-type transport system involved in multi-copper enzyme maturation permease subunit
MLWKELFIERVGTFGRVGRWLGYFAVIYLLGGTAAAVFCVEYDRFVLKDGALATVALSWFGMLIGNTSTSLAWMLQVAVGLRAAAGIASERERQTWDAILTSPLEANEIVWGKLSGSLRALAGIGAAALIAWTVALAYGAMNPGAYVNLVATTLSAAFMMAAIGVWCSLQSPSVVRAMLLTVGGWLAAMVGSTLLGGFAAMLFAMIVLYGWFVLTAFAVIPLSPGPPFGPGPLLGVPFVATGCAAYLTLGLIVAAVTRKMFDEWAGRRPVPLFEQVRSDASDAPVSGPAAPLVTVEDAERPGGFPPWDNPYLVFGLMYTLLGPFALPWLWICRSISLRAKALNTLAILAITAFIAFGVWLFFAHTLPQIQQLLR